MRADELRRLYLDYFVEHGHRLVESSSLVPKDPTLLFTSAGMVQFKDIFWGRVDPPFPSATTCQKCFRTTDIENVGHTAYHHTFFEMLGNFSFGNYFKEEAIELAWGFLTKRLQIPQERLWVSVYEEDDEAYAIWRDRISLPRERIVRLGKEHNWWGPVGKAGPCGPDSEIFYDTGEERACGPDCQGVACDCDRFSEIWNLVFTQYDAREDGALVPLEQRNIDTGMGLERTCAVLQGVKTDFDIDLFLPIAQAIEGAMPRPYTEQDQIDRNIVADHIRGVTFLIADGVLPSNERQGYVLRRILRRAIRAGERLDLPLGALSRLVDAVVETLDKTYPEIVTARPLATRIISHETETFRRTLRTGERRLQRALDKLRRAGDKVLPGRIAFELYDTYGFPVEMTTEITQERGIEIDQDGFEHAMAEQRARSRNISMNLRDSLSLSVQSSIDVHQTEFLGYETLEVESNLLRKVSNDDTVSFVFDKTTFYAESGGQVGDRGRIENLDRPGKAEVINVQKDKQGVFQHTVSVTRGTFAVGDRCRLIVDDKRRKRIARNHSATHILHAALRQVLGGLHREVQPRTVRRNACSP